MDFSPSGGGLTMSLIILQSNGLPLCIDTDQIPDEPSPVLNIALELALAGFKGIRFTKFKIDTTRDGILLEVDKSSHEGMYLDRLVAITPLPTQEEAIEAVKTAYANDVRETLK